MGKTKPFKAENRDFKKEIHILMKKHTRKEKHKYEEFSKTRIITVVEGEGTSVGVSEKGKTTETDMKNLKKNEWDKDWKAYLETQEWTYDQIWEL